MKRDTARCLLVFFCVLIVFFCGTFVRASDLTSSHFIVRDPVVDTGGGYETSSNFKLYSAQEPINGESSSTGFKDRNGFLEYPSVKVGIVTPTVTGSTIALSWPASIAANGWTVGGYSVGIANVSGGPYTFTSIGNVTTYSYLNQLPNTYYIIVVTLDSLGNIIGTANEVSATVQESVTFSLSDNAVSFGSLSPASPRYATVGSGSSSDTAAHTITAGSNATSGYSITYQGQDLANGLNTIPGATVSGSTTGATGTNQFALSFSTSGAATITSSYDQSSSNWLYVPNSAVTIASTSGPSATDTINSYYLANISTNAAAGNYLATITYTLTANY